jgi:hypothetical protein
VTQQVSGAWRDYFLGKSLTARWTLAEALKAPEAQAPVIRLEILEALLDICIQSHVEACVGENAQAYVDTAETLAGADAERRREYALRAAYYFDRGRLALHEPEVTAKILDWPPWSVDAAAFPRLELQRQVLAARIRLELDDPAGARREIDKLLAMAAALDNPQEDRLTFAWSVTEAIWALTALGESDRA